MRIPNVYICKPNFMILYCLTALLVIAACRPTLVYHSEIETHQLKDGVYEGYFKHINSASVEVIISENQIAAINILTLEASPIGLKARDSIPARIVKMQTPYVDAVSGATSASNTIINATVNALRKALY